MCCSNEGKRGLVTSTVKDKEETPSEWRREDEGVRKEWREGKGDQGAQEGKQVPTCIVVASLVPNQAPHANREPCRRCTYATVANRRAPL